MVSNSEWLDQYLDNPKVSAEELAQNTGVSLAECEDWLLKVREPGQVLRLNALSEPPTHLVHFIRSEAERALFADQKRHEAPNFVQKIRDFLAGFLAPSYRSAFAVFTVSVLAVSGFNAGWFGNSSSNLTVATAPIVDSNQNYATPLDHFVPTSSYQAPQKPRLSLATPVSLGGSAVGVDELDAKILQGSSLSNQEFESLFFRARKFERTGLYKKALQDYQFLATVLTDYQNQKNLQIAIAHCYDNLKETVQAIRTLENFENTFGQSKEIDLMIDELKSVTF